MLKIQTKLVLLCSRYFEKNFKNKVNDNLEDGFVMLEVCIALIVVGIVSTMIFSALQQSLKVFSTRLEAEKEEAIMMSLASYVLKNGHLPCPSETEDGIAQKNCRSRPIGFLPYRTLELPESFFRNNKGEKFYYIVDENLTYTKSLYPRESKFEQTIGFCTAETNKVPIALNNGTNINIATAFSTNKADLENVPLRESADIKWTTRDNFMAVYAKSPCKEQSYSLIEPTSNPLTISHPDTSRSKKRNLFE